VPQAGSAGDGIAYDYHQLVYNDCIIFPLLPGARLSHLTIPASVHQWVCPADFNASVNVSGSSHGACEWLRVNGKDSAYFNVNIKVASPHQVL
jgi:hypothetical protein